MSQLYGYKSKNISIEVVNYLDWVIIQKQTPPLYQTPILNLTCGIALKIAKLSSYTCYSFSLGRVNSVFLIKLCNLKLKIENYNKPCYIKMSVTIIKNSNIYLW